MVLIILASMENFVDICNGDETMARELFDHVDWQMPETLWDEWLDYEEED